MTCASAFTSHHLHFLCTLWPATDIAVRHRDEVREAVTAWLIHEVPCKDGGVISVQPVVDGVTPVHHGVNVVLEELLHLRLCEEDVVAFCPRPLNILQRQAARFTIYLVKMCHAFIQNFVILFLEEGA